LVSGWEGGLSGCTTGLGVEGRLFRFRVSNLTPTSYAPVLFRSYRCGTLAITTMTQPPGLGLEPGYFPRGTLIPHYRHCQAHWPRQIYCPLQVTHVLFYNLIIPYLRYHLAIFALTTVRHPSLQYITRAISTSKRASSRHS